jgi:nucleoside-diphosphate-sugar epimerase
MQSRTIRFPRCSGGCSSLRGPRPRDESEPLDLDTAEPRRTTLTAVKVLESSVLKLPQGVVLRFGQLYGPGTWFSQKGLYGRDARVGELSASELVASFIHTSDAASAILLAITWRSGVWNIVDDDPAAGTEWAPQFAAAVHAPEPNHFQSNDIGRPVSNSRARSRGLDVQYPSLREGFQTL